MAGPNFREKSDKEKEFDAKKFVQEWIEYKESQALWEEFWWSSVYFESHSKIIRTLDNQSKLKELLENLQNKKPIIPIIFGEDGLEADKESGNTSEDEDLNREAVARSMLAEVLIIKPDMSNELVVILEKIAILLAGDEEWSVRCRIAGNTDIMPNIFAKLAEKLKNEEDWRVAFELLSNPNTPKEIVNEIKEKYKTFLTVYKTFEELESLFKQLLRETYEQRESLIKQLLRTLEYG